MNKKRLDVFHIQVVAHYFKLKSDFINIIQVRKQFQYVLDRFRINPIPITKDTKNLFQYINTQQFFWKHSLVKDTNWEIGDYEIESPVAEILQYNCEVTYSQYLEMLQKKTKQIRFKAITYTAYDKCKYGRRIPEGVQVIGSYCFEDDKRTKIEIPKSVTKISDFSFWKCQHLKSICIPNNVVSLGFSSFECCYSLSRVELSTNITSLKNETFKNNHKLKHINIPPYLRKIGDSCFVGCEISEISFPITLTKINIDCFENCKELTKINIENIEILPFSIFRNCCNLKEVYLGNSLQIMQSDCFSNCNSLSNIVLPSSLKSIKHDCFKNCISLESLTIPKNVTFIGNSCFEGCKNLKELIIENEECQILKNCFYGCSSLTKLQIPLKNGMYPFIVTTKSEKKYLINLILNIFFM